MNRKKFAFLLMGELFHTKEDHAHFVTEGLDSYIITVNSISQAYDVVKQLAADGVGVIELCGAFGPEVTQEFIELTDHKVAFGYVTHFPSEDDKFNAFFGG